MTRGYNGDSFVKIAKNKGHVTACLEKWGLIAYNRYV